MPQIDSDLILFAISVVLSILFPSLLIAAVIAQEELDKERYENDNRPVVTFVGTSFTSDNP